MNFRNIGDAFSGDGNLNARKSNADPNYSLSRQSSVYALTFDEFQNTWGGSLGKDFGSMNMDELLKSIWTAEESHAMTSASAAAAAGEGNLQRQGSLTLPRTLSQKTVDEVWKDLFKEITGVKEEAVQIMPQRQRTLGEMTLEEFLLRAGVVREDAQKLDGSVYGDLSNNNNSNAAAALAIGFQQMNQNNGVLGGGSQFADSSKFSSSQSPSLAMDVSVIKQKSQQQQFSKPVTTMPFSAPSVTSPGKGKVGVLDQSINFSMTQCVGLQNGGLTVASLEGGGCKVVVPTGPQGNQMIVPKSSSMQQSSSASPAPYSFGRGRKPNGTLEKVVERRQRRMIKNRESAARSRARKQAYTLELEAEVAKLKELNQELQRKQDEYEDMQKNQVQQTVNWHWGSKRLRLRRTLTGPW